ncbi:MAG TPA: PDZ domain-containing protein [Terriglobia bacterium]|nr:PDZ domain-containing protein [Terriglobia bacterium]
MANKMKFNAVLVALAIGLTFVSTPLHAQEPEDNPLQNEIITVSGGNASWLGVQTKDLTSDQVRDLKLGDEYGALVEKVEPDSPAAKAGLQKGDVIVQFAGERVRSVAELTRLVRETPVGRSVEIQIRRNGAKQTLNATITARKSGFEPLLGEGRSGHIEVWPKVNVPDLNLNFGFFGGPRLGVSVEELTPQLASYFGVKDGKGVLVTEVSAGSAAEKAGLKAGDCIIRVDSTAIESADDVHRALSSKSNESHDVTVTIVRDRKEQTLQAHLEAPERPHFFPNTAEGRTELQKPLAEARAQAKALADSSLGQKLESERAELDAHLEEARASAKVVADQEVQLRLKLLKDQGQWREQLKQLAPEMKELRDRLQQLRDQYAYGVV